MKAPVEGNITKGNVTRGNPRNLEKTQGNSKSFVPGGESTKAKGNQRGVIPSRE